MMFAETLSWTAVCLSALSMVGATITAYLWIVNNREQRMHDIRLMNLEMRVKLCETERDLFQIELVKVMYELAELKRVV